MKQVSVIVPAYNAENYIVKCLESLINQDFNNYEIVVVNDGSKDNTMNIITEYQEKYKDLIRVISQENKGLSKARNTGIENSVGKYIVFVDSDDYVEKNMLKILHDKIISDDFDIVACAVNVIYPQKNIRIDSGIKKDCKNKEEIIKIFNDIYVSAWNKIYKRSLFDKVQFKEGIWFEDVNLFYKLLPYINSIGFVDDCLYNYVQRENSITYTYNDNLYQIISNFDNVIEFYKENNFYEKYKDVVEYAYIRYSLATFIKRLAKSKDKNKFREGLEFAIKNLKEKYPDYKNNYYLNQKGIKNLYLKYFNKFIAYTIFYKEKNKMN